MRTKEVLVQLLEEFKLGTEKDFCQPYDSAEFRDAIITLKRARVMECVKRRLGHLPDADFFAFVKVFTEDAGKPRDKKEVIQTVPAFVGVLQDERKEGLEREHASAHKVVERKDAPPQGQPKASAHNMAGRPAVEGQGSNRAQNPGKRV